jgi:hypothetical protein
MKFDDETTGVLIGGYLLKDAAQDDYEAALASGGYPHGAVVVSKDLKGNVPLERTSLRANLDAKCGPASLKIVFTDRRSGD